MKIVYSDDQRLHALRYEMSGGEPTPCFEKPSRADMVLEQVIKRNLGEVLEPKEYSIEHVTKVHDSGYIAFLENCWPAWEAEFGAANDATPEAFPMHDFRHKVPAHIKGQLGYYSFDLAVGLSAGSWQAIKSSANVALSGADIIASGERTAFSLCRPPGHHASAEQMGGYCYVNNVAVAAQHLRDKGYKKVAILDVDYHHGNGTQSIFYNRDDVFVASIHGDPDYEYPYFSGYGDETGEGAGLGCNLNIPLTLHTTDWVVYKEALQRCIAAIKEFDCDVLLISLGLDTFENDPISSFKLKSENFTEMGKLIESMQLSTLFVFEGGYAVEDLGVNTANVLLGFQESMA
ncbi:histone deacetylase family protein [Dasania sp. GY-MA-18]|uniref:Histone deacetylase family protein n=1 Tax=Dasania phycosphaerae TaxID=2950436 RepID=A0A9J6RRF4_9GAMM|nr:MULTISPECIES: histone deacetylase family protein [Dasania]MCR8924072.1 histone deacetylase family protein [Dasania sp. GY-MA-18]MCZ0866645.1 histone deacetylase family protein [Dasania phycosphaerae]MCZ0870230.1 histone deacetylase family protein [Dasania phycosphaerae]